MLLLINSIKNPAYLALSVNPTTGLLTGNVLDILRVSAPIIMIALGMTFVIATGGIDLSVGSMMAVGGAVAMETLSAVERLDVGRRDARRRSGSRSHWRSSSVRSTASSSPSSACSRSSARSS